MIMERKLGWKLWGITTATIVVVLIVELVAMRIQRQDNTAAMDLEKSDTTAIINTVTREQHASFRSYLSGFWTSQVGLVRIDLVKDDTITLPHGKPIAVKIVMQDFSNGYLEFKVLGSPSQVGYIRKVWNSNAISLKMPGQPRFYLYHYLPLRADKTTTITVEKGHK